MERPSSGNDSDATEKLNADPAHPLKLASESLETLRLDTETARVSDRKGEEAATLISGAVSSASSGSALEPGKRFGSYNLLRLLGEGGFGQVWEAESLETGRRLALKVLTIAHDASPDLVERFKQEGRLAASLSHPSCVYIFRAEEIEGYPAITMELMSGGTLQNLLDEKGSLPVKEAVDYILQIIDGLEAAHDAGIVHRDVKPSNCFLDASGQAKIGDFGLSKTLEADTKLTATGVYIGTPSFSSPEQVRGRDVDFRSDIYAVGAMLYALLTGKPPFEGKGSGEVLARIVSEEPTPFSEHKVDVPKGLQRVILRCLAKDREKRYPSYAALRAALTPYSSEALTTGGLGKRFAAILVDFALNVIVLQLLGLNQEPPDVGFSSTILLIYLLQGALLILYFFIPEKLWGRSIGKLLFGLRVTSTSGYGLSLKQALLRSLVFVAFQVLPSIVAYLIIRGAINNPWISFLLTLIFFVPVVTMRKSNGYAGIHELASHTRVMAMKKRARYEASAPEVKRTELETSEGVRGAFGPYRAAGVIWESDSEALILGHDDALGRDVWIHWTRDDSKLRPLSEAAVSRPGRLHWLQGSRKSGDCWDAYEAPSGTSLVDWVQSRGRLSWSQMRGILLGLSRELEAGMERGDLPQELSLRSIWVDAHGQPKLLDVPVVIGEVDKDNPMAIAPDNWQAFLHQVVLFGLEGRLVPMKKLGTEIPRVPLPEYVRPLRDRLCDRGEAFQSLTALVDELNDLPLRPTKVTRGRRIGPLAIVAALPLILITIDLVRLAVAGGDPDFMTWGRMVGKLHQIEAGEDKEKTDIKREAIRKILAYNYAKVKPSAVRRFFLMPDEDQKGGAFESALKNYPAVTESEVSEARKTLVTVTGDPRFTPSVALLRSFTHPLPVFIAFFSFFAIFFSFIVRGGALLYLFGIAVQSKDGRKASRFRCLLRALVGWSPTLIPMLIAIGRFVSTSGPRTQARSAYYGFGARLGGSLAHGFNAIPDLGFGLISFVIIAGVIYSIIKPERGIQDLIVGTHLVPR